jgi:hypothetical protein
MEARQEPWPRLVQDLTGASIQSMYKPGLIGRERQSMRRTDASLESLQDASRQE